MTALVNISLVRCFPFKFPSAPPNIRYLTNVPYRPDILYHLNTIYLFTCNDLKFIVYPTAAFAAFSYLAAPLFHITLTRTLIDFLWVLFSSALWSWLNLLSFNIGNQRHPKSIAEDRINKPWRPLASERLSARQATILMLLVYPIVCYHGVSLDIVTETLALAFLGIWNNEFGGADSDPITRNFLNAAGYFCYNAGAAKIALRTGVHGNPLMMEWTTAVSAVIFTTIHLQDTYDQRGDAMNNRKTIPLLIGDQLARWTIAIPVVFWAICCPLYWSAPVLGFMACTGLGLFVALRTLCCSDEEQDKKTMKFWVAWLLAVYSMPLVKRTSELIGERQ